MQFFFIFPWAGWVPWAFSWPESLCYLSLGSSKSLARKSCKFEGTPNVDVKDGASVTAYREVVSTDCKNAEEIRICTGGTLSGKAKYASCRRPKACEFKVGLNVANGASIVAYSALSARDCNKIKQTRVCSDGVLSGSFNQVGCTNLTLAITSQPESITAEKLKPVSLSVSATGDGLLTYQWYRNGLLESGATKATYSFTMFDGYLGDYKVKVSNGAEEVFSDVVKVTMLTPPTITTQPTTVEKNAGEKVNLSVSATGKGILAYQWYKDNTPIIGATGSNYEFTMGTGKLGEYKVKVSNSDGEVYSVPSTVAYPIPIAVPLVSILRSPESGYKIDAQQVTLSVWASSAKPLSY